MRTENLQNLVRIVVASARAYGQRVLLGAPAEAVAGECSGSDVFAAQGVPHAWLFPRMRYILHHGGAGTTGAAAAAGVPSTATAFSADQAFWARQIHRLGLGPAAPPARQLTRDGLDGILKDALANPAYQQRARAIGENIREKDGVKSAIQIIERRLSTWEGHSSS
jgi:sterol 3beta-glucosyltransferase